MVKWQYQGDMNLECGGFFWRHVDPSDDFVEVVEVSPDSDSGGADNVFHIASGSVYLGFSDENKIDALKNVDCKVPLSDVSLPDMVNALISYFGVECDFHHSVRIGQIDPLTKDATVPEDDITQIRSNWKLKNYVKKHYLD